jgi:hypothetical protein
MSNGSGRTWSAAAAIVRARLPDHQNSTGASEESCVQVPIWVLRMVLRLLEVIEEEKS